MGNLDLHKTVNNFTGDEQLICKTLLSWVNDGSHSSHEELYISEGEERIDVYINVFKKIFKNLGHESHYKMMMS